MEEILYHENYNLETVCTPVNPIRLKTMLDRSAYDVSKTNFLVRGFTHGFDIGYNGPWE